MTGILPSMKKGRKLIGIPDGIVRNHMMQSKTILIAFFPWVCGVEVSSMVFPHFHVSLQFLQSPLPTCPSDRYFNLQLLNTTEELTGVVKAERFLFIHSFPVVPFATHCSLITDYVFILMMIESFWVFNIYSKLLLVQNNSQAAGKYVT